MLQSLQERTYLLPSRPRSWRLAKSTTEKASLISNASTSCTCSPALDKALGMASAGVVVNLQQRNKVLIVSGPQQHMIISMPREPSHTQAHHSGAWLASACERMTASTFSPSS